ncbi:MAG: phosphoadenylyl-sulfate reductase [Dehalococcoidia bacterium]|nr:phosphoadenylyl-sulfate reductase [Dehalococcoidia bacterium]
MSDLRVAALSAAEAAEANDRFAKSEPQEVLKWGLERYGSRIALSSAFGAEDVALVDMLWRLDRKSRVFTLDTLRLPTETYQLMDLIKARYGTNLETYYPNLDTVAAMVKENGFNLFYRAVDFRKLCCGVRKVEPVERALKTVDAWITGLRRDQATTRANVGKVELDEAHPGLVKLNPLADWSSDQVWEYVRAYDIPYNELHDKNYPSIGCGPCTRAVLAGEDPRAGRWWWESDPNAKECGLHVSDPLKDVHITIGGIGKS